ncbi:MAG: helix-turn-helix transcriptional regulator [Candidatus Tectomicrobia bacterium]|nr:helix-turn-helix transcriptional regulator [Candidatus Tectomicrobia bacterium]
MDFPERGLALGPDASILQSRKAPEDVCEVEFVDEARVASVRSRLKPDPVFAALAETFKVLGDPTRTKILFALAQAELCVCDLSNLLGLSQSAASHQLRVLRNMRLVKYRKEGRMVYYSLDDRHIETLFAEGLKHVEEQA